MSMGGMSQPEWSTCTMQYNECSTDSADGNLPEVVGWLHNIVEHPFPRQTKPGIRVDDSPCTKWHWHPFRSPLLFDWGFVQARPVVTVTSSVGCNLSKDLICHSAFPNKCLIRSRLPKVAHSLNHPWSVRPRHHRRYLIFPNIVLLITSSKCALKDASVFGETNV